MGLEGTAVGALQEGLAALPASAKLRELGAREGLQLPDPAGPKAVAAASAGLPAKAAPESAAPPAPPRPAEWRPPPTVSSTERQDVGSAAVRQLKASLRAQADFVEADAATWAAQRDRLLGSGGVEALLAEERRLRHAAIEAFAASTSDVRRYNLEFRHELMRPPCLPDLPTRVQSAVQRARGAAASSSQREAAEAALVTCSRDLPAAKSSWGELWSSEGPGALLEGARRLSESDAMPSRARELGATGKGTVHGLLSAIATEVAAAVGQLSGARVLVLGGHGASAAKAAQSGAAEVYVWERRHFVACASHEVLKRNLPAEALSCCTVSEERPPSDKHWDVVAVDLWDTAFCIGRGPLEALAEICAEPPAAGKTRRVIPAALSVRVGLADGRLHSVAGFDLAKLDSRFRGLALAPLQVAPRSPGDKPPDEGAGVQKQHHPTVMRPLLLTEMHPAFELEFGEGAVAVEEGPKALQLRALQPGRATVAVFHLAFRLGASSSSPSPELCLGQWLFGGLPLAAGEEVERLTVSRSSGRLWVDWDWAAKSVEPPFGYMMLSEWYFEMLRDSARHDLYEAALKVEVAAARGGGRCRVLDVGSGDGILSMMALRAGASSGAGVEYVTAIARASEEIIAANRRPGASGEAAPLPDVAAAPLEIWCTDARGITSPPEDKKFDVLVSELMDASGLGENLLALTAGARRRLCVPGAPVIPAQLRLVAVLCEMRLPELAGVNMDAFWPFWPSERSSSEQSLWTKIDLDKAEGNVRILTEPVELLSFELGVSDVEDVVLRKDLDFAGVSEGSANIVLWWFETQMTKRDPSLVLTNAPNCVDQRHAATCWGQAMAELPSPVGVRPGAAVELLMEIPCGDYQLTFRHRTGATASRAAGPSRDWAAPPPGAAAYSATYAEELRRLLTSKAEANQILGGGRLGRTALKQADMHLISQLQAAVACIAAQPRLFDVEPQAATALLSMWYAVGGEGRS